LPARRGWRVQWHYRMSTQATADLCSRLIMQAMAWEEIDKDWEGLQKRHRMEIAQAVARYCIGHKMKEVADHLGYSFDWVKRQLNYAGIGAVVEGTQLAAPQTDKGVDRATERILREFAPEVEVQLEGQAGNQAIKDVKGADSESFKLYLDPYLELGHEPAAAVRLAKAQWAAEEAVEAGVIKESYDRQRKRVNTILFPNDERDSFELSFKVHMARVDTPQDCPGDIDYFNRLQHFQKLRRKQRRPRLPPTCGAHVVPRWRLPGSGRSAMANTQRRFEQAVWSLRSPHARTRGAAVIARGGLKPRPRRCPPRFHGALPPSPPRGSVAP
jgi:hypothetical protein